MKIENEPEIQTSPLLFFLEITYDFQVICDSFIKHEKIIMN